MSQYASLTKLTENARKRVKKGGLYKHYKSCPIMSRCYRVLDVAIMEEKQDIVVIYQEEFFERLIWVRELNNWLEEVVDEHGHPIQRFTPCSNE